MTRSALASLYAAVRRALLNDEEWANRVFPDVVPAEIARPYAVLFWVAGGEDNQTKRQDARITLTVKCVADNMGASMRGAGRISELFNDQGSQDGGNIAGDGNWLITTITQGRIVHLVEMFEGAQPIYHDGHQFEFDMERI